MKINTPPGKLWRLTLGGLQSLIGIGGVVGGLGMLLDPSGAASGMTVELLQDSPFSSFFIPGLFLFLLFGGGNLAGALLSFLNKKAHGRVALGLGCLLLAWMLFQLYWIGLYSYLQPLFVLFGLTEAYLGFRLSERYEVIFTL